MCCLGGPWSVPFRANPNIGHHLAFVKPYPSPSPSDPPWSGLDRVRVDSGTPPDSSKVHAKVGCGCNFFFLLFFFIFLRLPPQPSQGMGGVE